MIPISKEYSGALAILALSILKIFDIELENGVVEGLIVGIIALVVAISRKSKGDINILGFRK